MKKRTLCSGFTLLELLLAVGVIAVLSAMVFSAMGRMRAASERTTCNNHLRQIHILMGSYATDHGGRLPPTKASSSVGVEVHWRRAILPYMGLASLGDDLYRTGLICPVVKREMAGMGEKSSNIVSFAMNYYLQISEEQGLPISRIKNPAQTLFFTEAYIIQNGLPREEIRPQWITQMKADQTGNYHLGSQNILFVDGHIEPFADIYRLVEPPFKKGDEKDIWTP